MTLGEDSKIGSGPATTPGGARPKGDRPKSERSKGDRDVGRALRSVYSHAVNEDIPPELLDLLGKLD